MIKTLLVLLSLTFSSLASTDVKESVVKIYTVSKIPSYTTPWNSSISRSHGSGSIIAGNRILTNAHVVANETFIEVKRHGDTKKYEAEVEFIAHQADLAILKLKDESFFEGTTALELDGLPKFEEDIAVYGFPVGGDSLSVSRGIVSRIEHKRYAHSGEIFLAIQVDAAVNPGSSGGPAISNGKIVGVVMQQLTRSQSIGYLVPVEIVRHFLNDIKDGKYDGFAHLGISTQTMENEALRDVYHMDKNQTGVLIIDISSKSNAYKKLQEHDILLSIDGHIINNDGTVDFIKNKFTAYKYYIDQKQIGESVELDILRKGKKMAMHVVINTVANDNLLVNTITHDATPKYLVYGGYVFSPLSRNLLVNNRSTLLRLREAAGEWATEKREEAVILLKVLASSANRGDHNYSLWMVDKVDGKNFKNFAEFIQIIRNFRGKHLIIENESGVKIAIDRDKARELEQVILNRYDIKNSIRW
ncbi:trypsin-like peptidase domain-containing protein [Sulfurimonas sp. SAG-AH-194-I05]|nr:trypsin-like peptidase domain-containing protein [Sulfurimonas sp. SAG-AH-194-I05]MDF1875103.1 trypsin-like peptidase domain-containing protein [Sulfurimonas sp. SAG-AH-194-I05]